MALFVVCCFLLLLSVLLVSLLLLFCVGMCLVACELVLLVLVLTIVASCLLCCMIFGVRCEGFSVLRLAFSLVVCCSSALFVLGVGVVPLMCVLVLVWLCVFLN